MISKQIIKKNSYYDSVTLMMISSKIKEIQGVKDGVVMMGTDYNIQLMKNSGFLSGNTEKITPNDTVISIKGKNEKIVNKAIEKIVKSLDENKEVNSMDERTFKTLETALKENKGINFTIISIPGEYAKREVEKALRNNINVMLFSDNVEIEEELYLKKEAQKRNLLMMGPDCGTAIINEAALGFANEVRRGNIGIVAASGTGAQETSVLIDRLGGGVSHIIGTGGRDLKKDIGGIMMSMGIQFLDESQDTDLILLVSKPPSKIVEEKIINQIKKINKPAVICFLGSKRESTYSNITFADSLEEAAVQSILITNPKASLKEINIDEIKLKEIVNNEIKQKNKKQKYLRGIFSGGTLCYESLLFFDEKIGETYSNIHKQEDKKLIDINTSLKHTIIDMGDDEFTKGKPHPMIDPTERNKRILEEAKDVETGVILFDVVIGYGSNKNSAGTLVPIINKIKKLEKKEKRSITLIATVCGTEKDPQVRSKQKEILEKEGVIVMPSNMQATRLAHAIIEKLNIENNGGL